MDFIPASFAKATMESALKAVGLKRKAVSPYQSLKIPANDWICSLYPRVTGFPSHTPPNSE